MTSASQLLRQARARAALTQAELGERAGLPQSVVSAYESGKREPSLTMLNKLIDATGLALGITLTAGTPRSPLQERVSQNRRELKRALAQLGASNVRVFGSTARGEDTIDSDVDLLVDVNEKVGLFALGRMRSEAERVLGAPVDIVPSNSLKPELTERVLAEAMLL